jgi:hypothetical protein
MSKRFWRLKTPENRSRGPDYALDHRDAEPMTERRGALRNPERQELERVIARRNATCGRTGHCQRGARDGCIPAGEERSPRQAVVLRRASQGVRSNFDCAR